MSKTRCFGSGDALYEEYHDEEWGRPLGQHSRDERELFERLALEGFLAGLSWLTILRKREAFRLAFSGFLPERVASFTDRDVETLMSNGDIIRNRRKIEATISNAQALLQLHADGDTLENLLTRHLPKDHPGRPESLADVPASTPESSQLAAEMKRLGFRFVGPVTMYSMWQAVGMVDDHIRSCWLVADGILA